MSTPTSSFHTDKTRGSEREGTRSRSRGSARTRTPGCPAPPWTEEDPFLHTPSPVPPLLFFLQLTLPSGGLLGLTQSQRKSQPSLPQPLSLQGPAKVLLHPGPLGDLTGSSSQSVNYLGCCRECGWTALWGVPWKAGPPPWPHSHVWPSSLSVCLAGGVHDQGTTACSSGKPCPPASHHPSEDDAVLCGLEERVKTARHDGSRL